MKIKANEKLSKFSSANLPCSSFQFGKLEDGQVITTGLANIENYETESELETKVDSLKTSGYYQQNKIQ